MSTPLPTTKGETLVFWTSDDEYEPRRGVLTSDGDGRWSLTFESFAYEDEHTSAAVWVIGSFGPGELSAFCLDFAMLFAGRDTVLADLISMDMTGRSTLPIDKPVKIMRGRKLTVTLTAVGSNFDGHPIIEFDASRPMIMEELFVLAGRLAKASDWYSDRMNE